MPNKRVRTVLIFVILAILASGRVLADSLWAVDGASSLRLDRYPVSGGVSDRSITKSGNQPILGVASGGGCLWALGVIGCRSVLRIESDSGDTTATLTLDGSHCGVSVAYGDGFLWVLLDNSQIARVDPSTGQTAVWLSPAFTSPALYLAYGGGFLWAVVNAAQVQKIDPSSGAILQTLNPAGTSMVSALTYGGGYLWAAGLEGANRVSKIDPASGAVLSSVRLDTPLSIAAIAYEGQATSPPSAPVVTDDGAYTTAPDRLHASWTGDPGIVEYQYAIGRSPSDLICEWSSAGAATDVTRTGLSLGAGTAYYWYVKARNAAGQWSAVGASDGIVFGAPTGISAVRYAAPGEAVVLSSVIVTARFDDCLYVESTDRSSGIRVIGTAQMPMWSTVDIAGLVQSGPEGNSIDPITWFASGQGTVRPLGMSCRDIAACSSSATGLSASGLLVRAWGRVLSTGNGCCYVDDGSNVQNASGPIGLRMLCGSIDPPGQDKLVLVTGIAGMFESDGALLPGIRLRDSADLHVLD